MIRHLKILLLSMVVIGLMTGSAFAAAGLNAGNTAVAAEKISASADYAGAAFNTAYQPGGPIGATTVLKISLSAGKFGANAAGVVKLCDGVTQVGATLALNAAGVTSISDLTLTAPLSSATVYTFTNAGACAVAATFTGVSIIAGSLANTEVSLSIDSVTSPGDLNVVATAPIFTVKNQFSATLTSVTSKLDFATGQKTFVAAGTALPFTKSATESQAALLLVSNETIADQIAITVVGACTNTLAAADVIKAKITGDLTGLTAIEYNDANPYTITTTDRTNGYGTLSIAGNNLQICASTDTPSNTSKALELTAVGTTGTSAIVAGTRTAQISLSGAGVFANTRDLIAAGTTSHIIQLDATQYYIPLVKVGTGMETYIKLQSKSILSGSGGVSVAILADDGSTVTYTGAGSIVSGTPMAITGTALKDAVTTAGKTVGDSFAAIVTVNTPQADLFAYANTCDATGCKRIPVKTVGGTIVE